MDREWAEAQRFYLGTKTPTAALEAAPSADLSGDSLLPDEKSWWPYGFAEWFALGLTLLPALLFLPGSQAYRLPLRMGAYMISVVAFALWFFDRAGRKPTRHGAERWLGLVVLWLAMMTAHPKTPNLLVGVAQLSLH